jgi:hypothetical protein
MPADKWHFNDCAISPAIDPGRDTDALADIEVRVVVARGGPAAASQLSLSAMTSSLHLWFQNTKTPVARNGDEGFRYDGLRC